MAETIGTGLGVAALFNGRAKWVTPGCVARLRRALPRALVFVSEDLEQARRHVERIARARPFLVLSGGGDGTATHLLNELRVHSWRTLPVLGLLKLGTGNGWARSIDDVAPRAVMAALPRLMRRLPCIEQALLELDGRLCTFAGAGWDGRIIADYQRHLDLRSSEIFGSRLSARLHRGLLGYLYSTVRYTLPDELFERLRIGQPRIRLESMAGGARLLFEGDASVAVAGTSEYFGFGFRAFPKARERAGHFHARIYTGGPLDALLAARALWRGGPVRGMHDFLLTNATFTFSRPLPFQIGGDPCAARERLVLRVDPLGVHVVDWTAALHALRYTCQRPARRATSRT